MHRTNWDQVVRGACLVAKPVIRRLTKQTPSLLEDTQDVLGILNFWTEGQDRKEQAVVQEQTVAKVDAIEIEYPMLLALVKLAGADFINRWLCSADINLKEAGRNGTDKESSCSNPTNNDDTSEQYPDSGGCTQPDEGLGLGVEGPDGVN